MKKCLPLIIFHLILFITGFAQKGQISTVEEKSYMIPMRDGVKLFTVVVYPVNYTGLSPMMLLRTPYSTYRNIPEKNSLKIDDIQYQYRRYIQDGYILVFQDMRGKFKSEGVFEMNRPLYHLKDKAKTDESTDAFDTVDWLVKNVKNNNGSVGIWGISYDGYTALDASVDPHPALKASSPQASPADMFLGDDFHHNGAFRLSYGFEYSYLVENAKDANSLDFPYHQYDLYGWYLKLGPLKNGNLLYYKNRLPSWNDFEAHPNYDGFWKNQSALNSIQSAQIPTLHVGGYFDQEDLNGPQIMYAHLEKTDSLHRNYLVLGPWFHAQWAEEKADALGKIDFGVNTNLWFQALQKQWFNYWLKKEGSNTFSEATCFQTGTNDWKTYDSWPPKNTKAEKLYVLPDHTAGFTKPVQTDNASVSYISDPANPIPYRSRPIEQTYKVGSRWPSWQVEDQRFVSSRPDQVSFTGDALKEDFTVTGQVMAHLFVSTTATDADFVVKLIDVYPDVYEKDLPMSGYELPVTMEVFRGRFRKSFEKPEPFVPGKPEEVVIDLHQINHCFLKGHRLMVQIQSSWFPVIDRNPQKYIPNIFEAKESDFIQATHTIYCGGPYSSFIELPVDESNRLGTNIKVPADLTAEKVIDKYMEAIGGQQRMENVKDLMITGITKHPDGSDIILNSRYKQPDMYYQDYYFVKYKVPYSRYYNNKDSLHAETEGRVLNADQKLAFKEGLKLFPELDYKTSGFQADLNPDLRQVGDHLSYEITISSPGHIKTHYFFDAQSGLKIKQFNDLPFSPVFLFEDYREVETGIKIPFSEKIILPSQQELGILGTEFHFEVKEVKVNSGLTEDKFK